MVQSHILHFRGMILPSVLKISVPEMQAKWSAGDGFPGGVLTCEIAASVIKARAEVNGQPTGDVVATYMRVFDLAQSMANTVAFKEAKGLSVHITHQSADGETWNEIAFIERELPELVTAFSLSHKLEDVVIIVAGSHRVRHAMNDLIGAITLPHASAVACARALEALRHEIAGNEASGASAWSAMHSALRVSSDYLKPITDVSKLPRHGNHVRVNGAVTTDIVRRSWIVMDRFLHFALNGRQPLNPEIFSQL